MSSVSLQPDGKNQFNGGVFLVVIMYVWWFCEYVLGQFVVNCVLLFGGIHLFSHFFLEYVWLNVSLSSSIIPCVFVPLPVKVLNKLYLLHQFSSVIFRVASHLFHHPP